MSDSYRLQRFVEAQNDGGTYDSALRELRAGRKVSHWMWFVFPQIAGLGRSSTAQFYAVSGLDEAKAYLAHPLLGARLNQCALALRALTTHDPVAVFGGIDAQKLQSSMTLFSRADPALPVYGEVLTQYFSGAEDPGTVTLLS